MPFKHRTVLSNPDQVAICFFGSLEANFSLEWEGSPTQCCWKFNRMLRTHRACEGSHAHRSNPRPMRIATIISMFRS